MDQPHPLSGRVVANGHVCKCVHVCTYVRVVVCVGGRGSLEMWAQTPLTELPLRFTLNPTFPPEDNLTCCQDLQGSRDVVQVWEGQVTWL